jgi:hypothetical protein
MFVARSAGALEAAPTTANPMLRPICFLLSVHFGMEIVLQLRVPDLSARPSDDKTHGLEICESNRKCLLLYSQLWKANSSR